jgi:hypothetical protein
VEDLQVKIICRGIAIASLATLLGFSNAAHAQAQAGWTAGGATIVQLGSGSDGNVIWTNATFFDCGAGPSVVRIDDTSPNLNRIWALAIAAQLSNSKVQFFLSGGCLGYGAKATDIRIAK